MPFAYHPDLDLHGAYQGYQGQHPALARWIFVGFDPKFPTGQDWEQAAANVLAYLQNGPTWCRENNRHHPMAPNQGAEQLTDYHNIMARLFSICTQLGVDRQAILQGVCFLDLLGKPTMGNRRDNRSLYHHYLNDEHNLTHLQNICLSLAENTNGLLIVPRWVLDTALNANLGGNGVVADIRHPRTIIARHFPYFFGQTEGFKLACLNALAERLVDHGQH